MACGSDRRSLSVPMTPNTFDYLEVISLYFFFLPSSPLFLRSIFKAECVEKKKTIESNFSWRESYCDLPRRRQRRRRRTPRGKTLTETGFLLRMQFCFCCHFHIHSKVLVCDIIVGLIGRNDKHTFFHDTRYAIFCFVPFIRPFLLLRWRFACRIDLSRLNRLAPIHDRHAARHSRGSALWRMQIDWFICQMQTKIDYLSLEKLVPSVERS